MGKHRTTRLACLGEETVRTQVMEVLFAWHTSDLMAHSSARRLA